MKKSTDMTVDVNGRTTWSLTGFPTWFHTGFVNMDTVSTKQNIPLIYILVNKKII